MICRRFLCVFILRIFWTITNFGQKSCEVALAVIIFFYLGNMVIVIGAMMLH